MHDKIETFDSNLIGKVSYLSSSNGHEYGLTNTLESWISDQFHFQLIFLNERLTELPLQLCFQKN